jgi:EPS-associated MarR family transcriptional regulator
MKNDQDQFNILLKIDKEKNTSQRQLASNLGFSLGKLNYLLNELIKKGLIKIKRFKKNENKLRYIYIITPEGISKRSKYAVNFLKRKMAEYEELKKEISKLKKRNHKT